MAAAKIGEPLPSKPHRTVTSFIENKTAARNGKISSVFFHERSDPSQEMIASPLTISATPKRTKGPDLSLRMSMAKAVKRQDACQAWHEKPDRDKHQVVRHKNGGLRVHEKMNRE